MTAARQPRGPDGLLVLDKPGGITSRAALDRAAELIRKAERPLVMLGAAASRPRSTSDLAQFVLRTQIPFFTTQMGKGTVPGGTDLYIGTAALSERDYVHEAIERGLGIPSRPGTR